MELHGWVPGRGRLVQCRGSQLTVSDVIGEVHGVKGCSSASVGGGVVGESLGIISWVAKGDDRDYRLDFMVRGHAYFEIDTARSHLGLKARRWVPGS